jgi:hypothetical protein
MSAKIGRRVLNEVGTEFGQSVRKGFLDHAAVAHRGKIVTGLPAGGIGFVADVVEAGLEGFEISVAVAIEIEPHLVEIPQPAIDGKRAAPIIGIAFKRHAFSDIDIADDIGAAADRFGQARVLERRDVDGVLRQHRHQPQDQRQFAVA